jgi:hypothetical protein
VCLALALALGLQLQRNVKEVLVRLQVDACVQADVERLQTQMQSVISDLAEMKRALKGTSPGSMAPGNSGEKVRVKAT